MNNFQKILLSPSATIRQSLAIIDSGAKKIAIVADENQKLLGTLTDGDIRRAILNGGGLMIQSRLYISAHRRHAESMIQRKRYFSLRSLISFTRFRLLIQKVESLALPKLMNCSGPHVMQTRLY